MNVSKVKVNFGGTANIGDYENVKFDVQMEADLQGGETEVEVSKRLFEMCRQLVISQALTIRGTNRFVSRVRHVDHENQTEVPF